MRILFDQGTPVPLRGALPHHAVETAYERSWQQLTNGQLLNAAEAAGFELLITTDQQFCYQQNLASRRIRILVLRTTSWPKIEKHTNLIAETIDRMQPGEYRELLIPS
jgi:predicted nuclease of predicted toxin-antitoxin system